MKLSKELAEKNIKYPHLEGKEDLRFELFSWLQSKNLTVQQATNLLDMTKGEIRAACRITMDNMMI